MVGISKDLIRLIAETSSFYYNLQTADNNNALSEKAKEKSEGLDKAVEKARPEPVILDSGDAPSQGIMDLVMDSFIGEGSERFSSRFSQGSIDAMLSMFNEWLAQRMPEQIEVAGELTNTPLIIPGTVGYSEAYSESMPEVPAAIYSPASTGESMYDRVEREKLEKGRKSENTGY